MRFKLKYQDNKTLGIQYVGNSVTCVRMLDETTKGGNQKQIYVCTISRWDTELPEQAIRLLTKAEVEEWKSWKIAHDAAFRRKQLEASLDALPLTLSYAATALTEQACRVGESRKTAIWGALDAFNRALLNAGVDRPSRGCGRLPSIKLASPEIGLPIMPNLEHLGSPLECAYRGIVERYKALLARYAAKKSDTD